MATSPRNGKRRSPAASIPNEGDVAALAAVALEMEREGSAKVCPPSVLVSVEEPDIRLKANGGHKPLEVPPSGEGDNGAAVLRSRPTLAGLPETVMTPRSGTLTGDESEVAADPMGENSETKRKMTASRQDFLRSLGLPENTLPPYEAPVEKHGRPKPMLPAAKSEIALAMIASRNYLPFARVGGALIPPISSGYTGASAAGGRRCRGYRQFLRRKSDAAFGFVFA
jgi:hypothetical protein